MSNSNKLLPKSNIRYRQTKSPDPKQKNNKNNNEPKKISVLDEMQQMKQRREDRKKRIEEEKQHKKDLMNDPNYIPKLDYDFEYLVYQKKKQIENIEPEPHSTSEDSKIYVCVRKRPIFDKEIQNGEIDCVSAINPKVCIYDCKLKIDGYTKYIDTNDFYFDNVFNENENTELLFECSVKPSLDILLNGGVVTCFAYGQTGSGKTYTMKGIQDAAIYNIFDDFSEIAKKMKKKFKFFISFFEIYSGRLYDLLNNRNKVQALEDKNQKVQIYGLTEKEVYNPKDMQNIVDYANAMRTTHNTVTNETSSRSHAICNFTIKIEGRKEDEEYAKLTLVDLAGSERATETQSNDKSRLAEGAEINKSLLALKECIRALDARKNKGNNEQHVPFRNSKLTLVLRDSFLGKANLCKIIMISCVSPSNHSTNHTINTLRYADRLKEKTSQNAGVPRRKQTVAANTNNINYNKIINNQKNKYNNNNYNSDENKKLEKNPSLKKIIKSNVNNSKINKSNNNIGFSKKVKDKDKEKRDISEGKRKNANIEKKINNFFDDIDELDEDNMQKLNLKPTPIYHPNKRITFEKRKKYALQKKTNTQRLNNEKEEENTIYLYNNNTYCQNENENIEINNLIVSSGSVDSKIRKAQQNKGGDDINKMKKSYEGNIFDIDFDDMEQEEEKDQIIDNINDDENDNDNIRMNDNNESNQEEIKIEINKERKIQNNENKENQADKDFNDINHNKEDNNENININKTEESSTNINTMLIDNNIQEQQENIISNHINIIKNEAQLLSEEGNLISKIKGIAEENYSMEEYMPKIEEIIQIKLSFFKDLKQKIIEYKSQIHTP